MSMDIQVFTNQEFNKEIRAIEIDNEPWFVGKDVAEALGYSDTDKAVRTHVDLDDKQILNPADLAGLRNNANLQIDSPRGLTFINEAGLYSLVMSSKLPNAKAFKRWVIKEILPSIRKTGSYCRPLTYLEALEQLVVKEKERLALEESYQKEKERADENQEAANFQKQATSKNIKYRIGTAAKCLSFEDLGQNKLFSFLRDDLGVLFYNYDGMNEVKQEQIKLGRFQMKFNETYEYPVVYITVNGMRWVYNKLLEYDYKPLMSLEEWERRCQEIQDSEN